MLNEPPFQKRQMPGADQQTAPAGDADSVPEEQASPEEQAQYEKLMKHCYKLMADEKAFPALEKMLDQDPLNAIADATLTVIERLERDMGEQDPDMLQALAEEIIPQLAELAETKGIDIPEDQLEQVAAVAIGKWMEKHPERVDPAARQIGEATLQAVGQPAQQQPPQQPVQEVVNG